MTVIVQHCECQLFKSQENC